MTAERQDGEGEHVDDRREEEDEERPGRAWGRGKRAPRTGLREARE
jgi:hypothetical protein